MLAKFAVPVALAAASVVAATAADAAINITVEQSGSDVVMAASGSFDTSTATVLSELFPWDTYAAPGLGLLSFNGRGTTATTEYELLSAISDFGDPTVSAWTFTKDTSGTQLQVAFKWNRMILPTDYVSNSTIASRAVYQGTTLAQMGLVRGIYSGLAGTNQITVAIDPAAAAVPEASTWALMILGFGVAGAAMRRRRTSVAFA